MAVSEEKEAKQENEHMKEIEELVFDQDTIVTYKKLSKLLDVHVNKAKRLLNTFVTHTRRGKRQITVAYLVSGRVAADENGKWLVQVVPEDKLEETKKTFVPESVSEHVYSIHQGSAVKDLAAIVTASRSDDLDHKHAAIVNKAARIRSNEEMQKLIKTLIPTAPAPVRPTPAFASKKPPAEVAKPPAKPEPKEEAKEETKSDSKKEGQGTISGMFAAQNGKPAAASKPSSNNSNNKGKKALAGGASIASFFQRQNSAPAKTNQDKPASSSSSVKPEENNKSPKEEKSIKEERSTSTAPSKKANGPAKTNKTASKRKGKIEDDGQKKRKRIMMLDDSESSDDSDAGCDDEMRSDSPPPPLAVTVPDDEDEKPKEEPQEEPVAAGYVRERKLVDKVYQDEKGFIVTKKEWVTEMVKIEEKPEKKPVKVEEKLAPAPTKKKHQSDIMSFFGRK